MLGIYVVASWAVLQVADTLASALGLPDWFPPLALALLVVGLPIVLATAFVQEGIGTPDEGQLDLATEPVGEPRPSTKTLFTWRNAILGGMAAFALWGVVAAGWLLTGTASLAFPGEAEDRTAPRAIAVLPLQNLLGTDPEEEYFVDGLTDLLTSELSKIGGLEVKSYTSVMRYKDSRPPMPEIGRELGADFLIEGTVAKGENEVRFNIQLIDAAEDRHIWARNYRRPLADILQLQEEVARAIAAETQIGLDPEARLGLARAGSIEPEAAAAYMKGRYQRRRHALAVGTPSWESLEAAVSYLHQAIDLAPSWAAPYAELANTYIVLATRGGGPFYHDSAKASARAALELDPDLSQAHASLAVSLLYRDLDWMGAERAFERALQLDPNSHHEEYAAYLIAAGRYPEAITAYRRAEERDPFRRFPQMWVGFAYICNDQPDRAIEQMRGFLGQQTGVANAHAILGSAYLRNGEYEQAVTAYEQAVAINGGWRSHLGYVKAMTGEVDQARQILEDLEEDGQGLPELYLVLGDPEAALRTMERWYEEKRTAVLYLRCTLWLGLDLTSVPELRDDPRFRDLLRRIDFPR